MKRWCFFLILVLICGCTNLKQEQTIRDIKSQVSELEKRLSKTNAALEEMNNKFLLLKEQLDISKKDINELKIMAAPFTPPEELKVVKLEPEATKKLSQKKRG